MRTLYIAGPFRGKDGFEVHQNVVKAETAMYTVIEGALRQGTPLAVCCPHAMTVHLDRTFNDEYWLEATMEWLLRSDLVLMLPGYERSTGTMDERARALAVGIPVFYEIEKLLSYLQSP